MLNHREFLLKCAALVLMVNESVAISCDFIDTRNISSGILRQDGSYFHNGVTYPKNLFATFDYVHDHFDGKVEVQPHVRGCICKVRPCIRICCRDSLDIESDCVKSENLNVPTRNRFEEIDLRSDQFAVIENWPCKNMYTLEPAENDYDKWFFENGAINLTSVGKVAEQKSFCFGQIKNETGNLETIVSLCLYETTEDARKALYPFGMIISIPFLLTTFCIYGFFSELRNLHGKSLMCFVLGLLIMYTFLIIIQFQANSFALESIACVFCGYMIYMGVLLSFFWMNVMCYDIWSTFSKIQIRIDDFRKFVYYCLYAFGVPLTFCIIVFTIDFYKLAPTEILPGIGVERCWIQKGRLAEAIYVYGPITIILVVNTAFCAFTAYKIFKAQKKSSEVRQNRQNADQERFFLYLRLFVIMGATWMMESVSWAFDSPFVFYFTDVLNCLQGIVIFILFVWKPKIKALVFQCFSR